MSAHALIPQNVTRYWGFDGQQANQRNSIVVPYHCLLRNLVVIAPIAPGAGESIVFTLMVNNIASTITATIADAATIAEDLVNTEELQRGDWVNMRSVHSALAADSYVSAALELVRI